jgi:hypothetical protein
MVVISTVALLALVALCIWRKKLRISYELWQLTHDVLGVAIIATALAHVFLVGYYVDEPWERLLWLAMSGAFVVLLVWVRIVRPLQLYRSSWRVEGVVPEQNRRCPVGTLFSNVGCVATCRRSARGGRRWGFAGHEYRAFRYASASRRSFNPAGVLECPAQPVSGATPAIQSLFQPSTEASYASPAHERRPQGLIKLRMERAKRR